MECDGGDRFECELTPFINQSTHPASRIRALVGKVAQSFFIDFLHGKRKTGKTKID